MFQFLALVPFLFLSAIAWGPCNEGSVSEVSLRRSAIRKVMPIFPEEAIKANAQGVTVAQIRLDEKGELSSVQILQAPHESIARATAAAVRQWAFYFDLSKEGEPICLKGKLTFYFVIENGRPYVRDPKRFR
jgi:TonB family protein